MTAIPLDDDVATLLADLEGGRRRAASPDPTAPGGWCVDAAVKAAILAAFRQPAMAAWRVGPLRFRDRSTVPPPRSSQRLPNSTPSP